MRVIEKILLIMFSAVLVIALFYNLEAQPIVCTQDAKLCPNGSYVGRVPPDCDFAPCPSECPEIECIWDPCPGGHLPDENGCINCASPCKECACPEGYVQEGDVCNPECYYSTPRCFIPSISCSATCNSDSDCVGVECCHPTSCINKKYRESCEEIGCTAVCQGPLDCGAGSCACVNNRCVVESNP